MRPAPPTVTVTQVLEQEEVERRELQQNVLAKEAEDQAAALAMETQRQAQALAIANETERKLAEAQEARRVGVALRAQGPQQDEQATTTKEPEVQETKVQAPKEEELSNMAMMKKQLRQDEKEMNVHGDADRRVKPRALHTN